MSYKKIVKHVDYKKNGWGYNSMTPTKITIHNTANDAPASNERNYVANGNERAPSGYATYHYAIDEKEAYEIIPLNVNGWHSGDGTGSGNMKSLGIEICYSKSGGSKFNAAELNAIILAADLCEKYNIKSSQVFFHKNWSGKNCPHRTLTTLGLDGVRKEIDIILSRGSGGGSTSTKSFNQCYVKKEKKWYCQKKKYNDPCPIKIPISVLTGNKLNKSWNGYQVNTEFRTYDCNKSSTKKTLVLDKNCDDNGLASMYKDFNCTKKISPQLNPKKFGGLTYNILEDKTSGKARRVKIKTEQLGTGWVTVIMSSGSKLKGRDIK